MRGSEEAVARPALHDDRIVVYRRFSSMLLLLVVCLAFSALGLWMALTPPSADPREALAPLAGVCTTALFLVGACIAVLSLIFIRRPVLVIDHGGIDTRLYPLWRTHVAWRNVDRITTDERQHSGISAVKYHYLTISLHKLKPPNSGYAQSVNWNRVVRLAAHYNATLGTARFAFLDWNDTMPGDDIISQVRARFALELKRYDISVQTNREFRKLIADFRAMHPKTTDKD